jgi:DNA-binding YbaB/EbfC family protein
MGFNMKQLQQMQARMQKMQEDLQNSTFEGTSGGGAVTVAMNGKYEVTAVKLDKDVVDPEDIGMLEDLILTACKSAFDAATEAATQAQMKMLGGMKLPPGMGF